jgi:hypothetical protein
MKAEIKITVSALLIVIAVIAVIELLSPGYPQRLMVSGYDSAYAQCASRGWTCPVIAVNLLNLR